MIWILLSIFVFLVVLSHIKFRWKYWSLNRFPGPISIPIVGSILYFYNIKMLLRNMFRVTRIYGSIIRIAIGQQQVLLTTEPEMIEFFLRSPKFTAKADNYFYLEPWLGRGILNAEGIEWHKTRKMITPAFHFTILEEHVKVFHTHCDVLINILRKDADRNHCIDIYPKVVHFTLDIIAETAMGIKTDVQNNAQQDFLTAMHFMTRIPIERSLSLWKRYDLLFRLSPQYETQRKYVKILEDFSIKVIEERKNLLLKNSTQSSELLESDLDGEKKRSIFLDILLNSAIDGKPLSNEKIITEVNNFMFGGHDTTASTISIMMYELANNKEVQDKIVAELKEIYGNDRDRPVSMQDMNEMRYMDLVIKEVLRFYGVVPFIGRKVTEDVDYKGTTIPKGTTIGLFLYGVHRSPALYEKHKEFIPERFSSANSLKPFSFIPFSAGSRNCLGQKYAVYEIKVTFAMLLRHFEFESAGPNYKMELQPEMVMKPVNGIYVKIKSRDF